MRAATASSSPTRCAALQLLARGWRRELGAAWHGVTGSTGKTSTKDILAALLRTAVTRTHASQENFNTEIGLPLTILEAERGTEALVLEMAMRGEGQIAELVAIAEPDVGVIVNVGPGAPRDPRHGRAGGRRQGRADPRPASGCRLRGARQRAAAGRPPARRPRHLDLRPGRRGAALVDRRRACARSRRAASASSSSCPTASRTTCSTRSPRWRPRGRSACRWGRAWTSGSRRCAARSWSSPGGVVVVNDCYNANPMSMRAALDHLAESPPSAG